MGKIVWETIRKWPRSPSGFFTPFPSPPHGRGAGFPALLESLFQNRSQCHRKNSSEDAPWKEGRERSDRWKETPAKGFRPRVSGRLLPSRLPSNESSGRLNPPWSLQPSPDRFPFRPQINGRESLCIILGRAMERAKHAKVIFGIKQVSLDHGVETCH